MSGPHLKQKREHERREKMETESRLVRKILELE